MQSETDQLNKIREMLNNLSLLEKKWFKTKTDRIMILYTKAILLEVFWLYEFSCIDFQPMACEMFSACKYCPLQELKQMFNK